MLRAARADDNVRNFSRQSKTIYFLSKIRCSSSLPQLVTWKMSNLLIANLLNKLGILPELVVRPTSVGTFKLSDLFDGFLWVQKRKRNIRTRWRLRYGSMNWKDGVKLWQPKRTITTCQHCGSFHEFHTICRNCFNEVNKKTQVKLEELRESQRTRSWFEPNVAQVKNPSSKDDGPKVIKET